MLNLITGFCLLFVVPSCIYFWIYFIQLDKTNQIDLSKIPYYLKGGK